jgi:flagellar hook assembly protein FlgD
VAGPVPAGRHAATWDGTDTGGSRVPAGVYFYRVSLGAARRDGKIVLLD